VLLFSTLMKNSTNFKYVSRYSSSVANLLDFTSFLLYYSWLSIFSLCVSCYLPVFKEREEQSLWHYLIWFPLLGPFLLLLAIFVIPLAILGWTLAFLISCVFSCSPFSWLSFDSKPSFQWRRNQTFSFATMNVILGVEAIGRFNNIRSVFHRLRKFVEILNNQKEFPVENLRDETNKNDAVLTEFPAVDFICFQEVTDRFFALLLAFKLKKKYSHFVFDASVNSIWTNLHLGGSGLMIASRFPILASTFHPFSRKQGWQHAVCYGVLVCKLDLGGGRVGILSNLHTMAYQGKEPLIDAALSEVSAVLEEFRSEHIHPSETLVFDVIGGDFNSDNMSPGDFSCASNRLFKEYIDPAAIKPGIDKCWAIGTERRQLTLEKKEAIDPGDFRDILVDDVRRRHFVLDADVEEQTFALMTVDPRPDHDGNVVQEDWGGMRRIDRLLYNKKLVGSQEQCRITGAGFVTAFSYLTDHVPVILTLRTV